MFQVILSIYIDITKLCSKNLIFYKDTYNKVMDGSITWNLHMYYPKTVKNVFLL